LHIFLGLSGAVCILRISVMMMTSDLEF